MSILTKDPGGNWVPTEFSGARPPATVLITGGIRYVVPAEVYEVFSRRQGLPPQYKAPRPLRFHSAQSKEERLELAYQSWRLVFRRKANRRAPGQGKRPLKDSTILRSTRILESRKVSPLEWTWWCWPQRDFRFIRRGIVAKHPSFRMVWSPARVEQFVDDCVRHPDQTWKKAPPHIDSVSRLLETRSDLKLALYMARPVTAAAARETLDAVCTEGEYTQLLNAATRDTEIVMASEDRRLAQGEWVWG